jgi:hypothetical protein
MKQSNQRSGRARALAPSTVAALGLLCVARLSAPDLAYAHGGGGFHGGGGGFHASGGFHGGGFRGGEFRGGEFRGGEFRGGWRSGAGWFYPYAYGDYPYNGYADYSKTSSPQTWYYCANPAGYYPYVTQCTTSWQAVPAS